MDHNKTSLFRQYLRLLSHHSDYPFPTYPTAYAYEQKKLVNRLKWDGADSPKAYLQVADQDFFKTLSKFDATSAAATYSPHRPLDDTPYYVKTRTFDDLNILFPDDYGNIFATHVVHVGPKGSGKTTVQNQCLKKHHAELEYKNILYVRCDAPKLYELFRQFPPNILNWNVSLLPTLEEYLDFQLIYILAKNLDSGLPKKVFNTLKNENITFLYKEARAYDSPLRVPRLISWFLESHVCVQISNYELESIGQDKSYLIDILFRDKQTRRREYFQWLECAAALKIWLRQNKYILLRIVDGIDNLHLNNDAGKRAYKAFLPEVSNFILRSAPSNEVRFAVMRNRTWVDILTDDPVSLSSRSIIQPHKINHIAPNGKAIARARISWLKTYFPNTDVEASIETASSVLPNIETFHENIRTLIVSTTSLATQVRFRQLQLGHGIDYYKHANIHMKRNLFLNGRFYLCTERDWPVMNREKGLPFLNPFWFPDDLMLSEGSKDPLFLRIRLLELLLESDLLESHLKSILANSFCYKPEHIVIAIDDARGFGWIDSKSEYEGTSALTYEISPTGKYLLNSLLTDVSVLYMLALDTRIPKFFFENELILVHTNHLHERSGYVAAAVITVLSFLYYLKSRSDSELKQINPRLEQFHYRTIFLNTSSMRQILRELLFLEFTSELEDKMLIKQKCQQLLEFAHFHIKK